ncbi:MAG: P-loop NTPase [Xanthomonadales bacterium]|nr:P-loop NTPase [Xanthomonadales bacterium]
MSAQYGVPLLGSLPLDIQIREQADGGTPTVVAMPDSDAAHRYRTIARNTAARLSLQARNKKIASPNVVIQEVQGQRRVCAALRCESRRVCTAQRCAPMR